MQKYKQKQDSCGQNKPTKHQIASISSNKSLIKHPPNNQNKSMISVLNTSDVNHNKSLHHRNKSSKHLQSHTFTNNTHQNSVNVPVQSNSHNNSKSNNKGQNQKKKSTGKKLTSVNTQSKLLAETAHGRSSSQYQNLLTNPSNKNQVSKNYKNIIKNRKQTKDQQSLNHQKDQVIGSKSNKDLKQQNHQKSINVSSFKDLKKKTSKSRSKSKQFQNLNRKSNQSKKRLLTEPSQITSKQNNMNQGNLKKPESLKKSEKPIKLQPKQKAMIIQNVDTKKGKQKNINQFQAQQYEKIPLYMLKSSTNSDIEFSNVDENTVKQLIKNQKISNKAYFYEGQIEDVVFCKDNFNGEEQDVMSKKQSNKLSKRFSKMNLQLSSECLNCLTQPDYFIQPKGIRNLYSNIFNTDQEIRSSKQTSQFSSKPEKSSSKRQLSKFRHGSKSISNEQMMHKSAILIQKVWRGYMTRKLLQRFIQEEEMRLFERMRQIDEMKRERREKTEYFQEENQIEQHFISHPFDNVSNENPIKIVDQSSENISEDKINQSIPVAVQHHPVNNSVNTLDYESQILPRDQAQTISFIVQFNNIASKHIDIAQPINIKLPNNQFVDEVHYTSVQSIDHLSKVQNIYQESMDFIVNPINNGSEFLKDNRSQQQKDIEAQQQDQFEKNNEQLLYQGFDKNILDLNNYGQQEDQAQNNQQKRQSLRSNFYRQQEEYEQIKKYNFFNNSKESVQGEKQIEVSQSYQQSSYNESSSIFYKPQQQHKVVSSITNNNNKFQSLKDQEEDSYKINQSASYNEQIYESVNNTKKSFNQQESSYCIADQTQIYQQKHLTYLGQPSKLIEQNLDSYQNQSDNLKDYQESYKIDEDEADNLVSENKQIIISSHQPEIQQKVPQNLVIQSSIPNKSNPNIFLLKSPKHQSLSKSYFSQSKSSKKNQEQQSQIQKIKKTSSLKQFFFKKSLLENEIFSQNQEIQLPIPTFSSHKLNLLAFPTEKQASSIQSLLHFRHQCLTHQHSTQFKEIQQLYVKQKISKQEFVVRLQQLACNFQQSAVSIKQAQKDIFNGYKALLKLIKDVLKDCKMLGLSQQKGNNVRFCRSMEIFFREKDKMSNQKCIFDDEYLWRFDDVMIDQLDKSKQRLLIHSKAEKSKNLQESMQNQEAQAVEYDQNNNEKIQSPSVNQIQDIKETCNKKLISSPVMLEKQLSRQSLSHHQLPQFISDSKPQKQNSGTKISPQKDEKKQILEKQVIVHPCNFDISELGSCEDDYFDEDQATCGQKQNFDLTQKSQQQQIIRKREMNVGQQQDLDQSSSYEIGEDQLSHKDQHEQQALKEQLINNKNNQEIQNLYQSDQRLCIQIEGFENSSDQEEQFNFNSNNRKHYSQQHQKSAVSASCQDQKNEYESLRTTQLRAVPDLHLVINNKNKEFLQNQHEVQDLLDQQQDDAQTIPVIKRQVYQLSCDSDQQSQEFQDKWETQQVNNQHDIFNGKERKIHSSNFYQRSGPVSLYQNNQQTQEESQLTKKYSSLADAVQQILIWEFMEEIVLNKNKPQSKTNFGKKITEISKNYLSNQSYFNQIKNKESFGQNNVIIINNEKSFKRTIKSKNDKTQKSNDHNRESVSKISNEEINAFLKTLYKQFPTFEENKSKLSQRMYPSPVQLLRSLRDSSMQDYFYDQQQKRKHSSGSNSQQSSSKNESQQNESSQKSYSENSNVDSQTSYLELGSYEFLLSQQLCESLIEKYITEVYDIEMDKKIRAEKEGNIQIQTIKKEFSEYLEMKSIMLIGNSSNNKDANILSPSRIPKQGSFQSIIRTRQLFLQHKQIQSQMLRKQILKIELHTILDSMNQELIKERQSKCGYSGIGLSQLALGTIERSGIQVASQQQYETLCNKAKYRLQKFVLNDQINLNDKLLIECQQSVTINDSQWIFYVTEALQFGLQIAQMIEQYLWEQTVRDFSKMQLKRKFRLDDSWILQKNKTKDENYQNFQLQKQNQKVKGKKVISINIVDSSEKQDSLNKIECSSLVNPFCENFEQKGQSFSDQNNQNDNSESSFEQQSQKNNSQEQINLPLKMSQDNQQIDTQVIQTVRNQTSKIDETIMVSSSPIQDEGHINYMNNTTSFDHSYQEKQFNQSNISIPKVNDYSKSFEDSNIQNQNQSYQFYQTSQQNINQTHKDLTCQQNDSKQEFEEDSYQLDEDQMQFDEELDKQLDQMNNY